MPTRKTKHNTSRNIMLETELYEPIRDWLLQQNYTVRSEVLGCDIAATKDDALIIIEMKLSFNMRLLMQAIHRQRYTDSVYVALPQPKQSVNSRRFREIKHLLRRLELGLIIVSTDKNPPDIDILFHPLPFAHKKYRKQRGKIIEEIQNRSGDYNKGGSVRKGIVTAYRENAIFIACCLERFGVLSPKKLRKLGTGEKTLSILRNNFYGWFERVGYGLYDLKSSGKSELDNYAKIAHQYRKALDNTAIDNS